MGRYPTLILVDLGGGSFDDIYSWPTALVSIKDVFSVTAFGDDGATQIISLQVWIGDQNGVINTWNLR